MTLVRHQTLCIRSRLNTILSSDILEIVNEDVIAICNSVTPPTFALTYAPPNRRKFSQINLCPWFLDYATKAKFADRSSIQANVVSKLARALDGLATAILYTEVDLLSLFDKVLLHEVCLQMLTIYKVWLIWRSAVDPHTIRRTRRYPMRRCRREQRLWPEKLHQTQLSSDRPRSAPQPDESSTV